jgi:peptide/nickel transport system permease protein
VTEPSTSHRSFTSRLLAHPTARWSLGIIGVLIVAAALVPPFLGDACVRQDDIATLKNAAPSLKHWLGTDQYSRDVFARLICGARVSLSVATLAVIMSMTLGTAIGLVAGYFGGRIDSVMMRVLDGFLSIPRVLLLLAVLTLWPVRLGGLILLLGLTGWFGMSRLVRAETRIAAKQPYIEAARALGASHMVILFRHLLPNVIASITVAATLSIGNVIALEAGLSYLGIGAPEPNASWGSMFLDGVDFYAGNWWAVLFPGITIVITVLSFNMLGDALRDVLDPRQVHVAHRLPELIVAERVKEA